MFSWMFDIFKKKDMVQSELDELHRCRKLLEESSLNIRNLKTLVHTNEQDVNLLEARAKSLLESDETEARNIFQRLQFKKAELSQKEANYQKALTNHKASVADFDRFQMNLLLLKRKSQEATLSIEMSNARRKSAEFTSTQKQLIEELNVKATVAEQLANLNTIAPNEFETTALDAEFEKWKSKKENG